MDIYSDTDSTSTANIKSFMQVASDLGCIKTKVLIDNASPTTALENIRTLIQEKVSAVVLGQVVAAAQPGLMAALNAAHIPAVSMYITAPGATFINPSNTASGLLAGTTLAGYYVKSHTQAPYVIIGAFPAAGAASTDRMGGVINGIKQVIPSLPSSHILQIDTKADTVTANAQTKSVLARIPSGSQILFSGVNDVVTYAMLQALNQSGRGSDSTGIGFGADPTGVGFVCNNPSYYGSVAFFPETTFKYVLPVVLAALHDQPIPAVLDTPIGVVTRATVATIYPSLACK